MAEESPLDQYLKPGGLQEQILSIFPPMMVEISEAYIVEDRGNCRVYEEESSLVFKFCFERFENQNKNQIDEFVTIYGREDQKVFALYFSREGNNLLPSTNEDLLNFNFKEQGGETKSILSFFDGEIIFVRTHPPLEDSEMAFSEDNPNGFLLITDKTFPDKKMRIYNFKKQRNFSEISYSIIDTQKNQYFTSSDEEETIISPIRFQENLDETFNQNIKEVKKNLTSFFTHFFGIQ